MAQSFPDQYTVEYEGLQDHFDFDSLLLHDPKSKNGKGELYVNFISIHRMVVTKAQIQQAINQKYQVSQRPEMN